MKKTRRLEDFRCFGAIPKTRESSNLNLFCWSHGFFLSFLLKRFWNELSPDVPRPNPWPVMANVKRHEARPRWAAGDLPGQGGGCHHQSGLRDECLGPNFFCFGCGETKREKPWKKTGSGSCWCRFRNDPCSQTRRKDSYNCCWGYHLSFFFDFYRCFIEDIFFLSLSYFATCFLLPQEKSLYGQHTFAKLLFKPVLFYGICEVSSHGSILVKKAKARWIHFCCASFLALQFALRTVSTISWHFFSNGLPLGLAFNG